MQYEVIKLDGRHSWHAQFEYMIEFSKSTWKGTGVLDFDRSRRWMNQTWGWTQDVETRSALLKRKRDLRQTAVKDEDINLHWSYSVNYENYRIYLFGEKELNWFQLNYAKSND